MTVAETCVNLADVERKMNNNKEAENLYLKAMSIYEAQFGRKHPEVAEICNNLGILYKNTGRLADALKNIEEGLSILEVVCGE